MIPHMFSFQFVEQLFKYMALFPLEKYTACWCISRNKPVHFTEVCIHSTIYIYCISIVALNVNGISLYFSFLDLVKCLPQPLKAHCPLQCSQYLFVTSSSVDK